MEAPIDLTSGNLDFGNSIDPQNVEIPQEKVVVEEENKEELEENVS